MVHNTDSSPKILPSGVPAMAYRRDIDGLRAIAVLAVVFYHFGLPGVQGGFVGVDIFFVISGYLIGGILWREYCQTGSIWLGNFYIRRFRRLAPAFAIMILVTTLISWALLLPFEFREYGKSLIAATVYLSNVLFFRSAGYFDTVAEDKPLLHTWSLSVEEQFYIFLPIFLVLLTRWVWGIVPLLVTLFAASLAACVYFTFSHPTATFFLFPFRAWEMLAGVLLAIWAHRFARPLTGYAPLSYIGLALVLGSVALIQPGEYFPGFQAIAPVLGTVLLLANGCGDNAVNRLLRSPVPVFIGLISYSLYLWHWPVFTLSSYLRGGYANLGESLIWMLVSGGLAFVSWRLVEQPVRHAKRLSGGVVLAGTVLTSAAILSVGAWLFVKDGLPDRFGPEAQPHIAASADFLQDWSRCYTPSSGPMMGLDICPIGPEGPPKVLVWGDSHVRAFKEGLDLAAHEAGTPGMILWRAGCPPLFDIRKVESAATPAQDLACANANFQIRQSLSGHQSVDTVLLVGRWSYYAEGAGVGFDAENKIKILPSSGPLPANQSQSDLFSEAMTATVAELRTLFPGVSVMRQVPEIVRYDSRIAAREAAHAGLPLAATLKTEFDVKTSASDQRFVSSDLVIQRLQQTGYVTALNPGQSLCDDQKCHALINGVGFYFDNNHITNTASLMLRGHFRPVFGEAKTVEQSEVTQ